MISSSVTNNKPPPNPEDIGLGDLQRTLQRLDDDELDQKELQNVDQRHQVILTVLVIDKLRKDGTTYIYSTATKERVAQIVAQVFKNKKEKQKIKNCIQAKHSLKLYKKVKTGSRSSDHFVATRKGKDKVGNFMCYEKTWFKAIKQELDKELASMGPPPLIQ